MFLKIFTQDIDKRYLLSQVIFNISFFALLNVKFAKPLVVIQLPIKLLYCRDQSDSVLLKLLVNF